MSIFNTKIEKKIDSLSNKLEKMKISEYVALMENTKKLLWKNFIAGLSKGVGGAIGFTILGAIVLIILRKLVLLNLPIIGQLIKDIVDIASQ